MLLEGLPVIKPNFGKPAPTEVPRTPLLVHEEPPLKGRQGIICRPKRRAGLGISQPRRGRPCAFSDPRLKVAVHVSEDYEVSQDVGSGDYRLVGRAWDVPALLRDDEDKRAPTACAGRLESTLKAPVALTNFTPT